MISNKIAKVIWKLPVKVLAEPERERVPRSVLVKLLPVPETTPLRARSVSPVTPRPAAADEPTRWATGKIS